MKEQPMAALDTTIDLTSSVPKYDTSTWRVGFEIEMLFGDLGLKRYRRVSEEDGGFDIASPRYCRDIAERLSKTTGVKWTGTEKPEGNGFFVVPERDLDPYDFSKGTVGGVELITPPLPMAEAEELRLDIIAAVTDMKNGLQDHFYAAKAGWHVNVDKSSSDFDGGISTSAVCAGLLEGADSEVDMLLNADRYGNGGRYTAPQHHAYGPALMLALHASPFSLTSDDLSRFVSHHCGRSKRFATNFGKLDRGYVELRHLGLPQFMEESIRTAEYLDTVYKAMTITFSNSGLYYERLFERFNLLGDWLHPLQDRFAFQTRDVDRGQQGRVLFDGDVVARISWNGVGEVRLGSDEDELRDWNDADLDDRVFPEHNTGLDADELLAGVAILAMDTLDFKRCDIELPTLPSAFSEALAVLGERFDEAGMIGSGMTSEM